MKQLFLAAVAALIAVSLAVAPDAAADVGVMLAVMWPVIPRSIADLQKLATAPGGRGMSEAVPWVLWSTRTYVDATTLALTFFDQRDAAGIGNMPTAGALPEPQWFEPYYMVADVLAAPQVGDDGASAIVDAWSILFGTGVAAEGSPTFELSLSGKSYGVFPLSFLHGSGGVHGFGWSQAASAGTTSREWQTNSVPDGGWPWNGTPVIAPTVNWDVTCRWPTVVDLSADRDVRLGLLGTLHRRIL